MDAQLQATYLRGARLQGVTCGRDTGSFDKRIKDGIGRRSDLSKAIFAGGLNQKNVDEMTENIEYLRPVLEQHIGRPSVHDLPIDSGAIVEPYTAEEAEAWIAEYEAAMAEAPEPRR